MKDTIVLITGCSTGVGRDLAGRLAGRGYTVIATARKPETIADLPVAMRLALDVTNQNSVDDTLAAVIARFGRIDVLVNNAGHSIRSAVEELDETLAKEMFDVNVWGLVRMTKAVLPGMRERRSGRIVHEGSVVGKFTWPVNGAYSASKHAVEALSDAMRLELKSFNIPVVLVEPGTIDTAFMRSSEGKSADRFSDKDSPYSRLYTRFQGMAANPARRGAPAEAVSRVIIKAIEAKKPKARYLAAVSPLYRAILAMNDKARDRLISKAFGID